MSTAKKKSAKDLVSVETDLLKERLNKLYQNRRAMNTRAAGEGIFEYLWDLKEKALLDHSASVEVPFNWLDQLEQEQGGKRH